MCVNVCACTPEFVWIYLYIAQWNISEILRWAPGGGWRISSWPQRPRCGAVLGFLSYYRSYVQDIAAKIAKPLYELLRVKSSMPQFLPRRCKSKGPKLPSAAPIEWNVNHQNTLERLASMLINPQVLAYPNFEEPFVLRIDGSEEGLGAILNQQPGGNWELLDMDHERKHLQIEIRDSTAGISSSWLWSGQCVRNSGTLSWLALQNLTQLGTAGLENCQMFASITNTDHWRWPSITHPTRHRRIRIRHHALRNCLQMFCMQPRTGVGQLRTKMLHG